MDKEFVRAVPPRFAHQMKHRVDQAFVRFPLPQNGYLWQTFRGVYPPGEGGLPLYLQPENYELVKSGADKIRLGCADAATWLEAQAPNSIGFFALSNILEITSPAYAKRLLQAVARAAKPNARLCLRSIFPFDDTPMKTASPGGAKFEFLPSELLENRDRSFFCKNLRVVRALKT